MDNEDTTPPLMKMDWGKFGQWAIILGVLVWVLQSHDAAIIKIDELNRQERSELINMIERLTILLIN